MRKIILHSPTTDRRGHYRDAGDELTVGAVDNVETDITTDQADELLASGRAVTLAEAKAEKTADK
jgi:hypothetical protein